MDDNECCHAHDGDKIGRADVGRLTQSRNKVVFKAFEDFHQLIANVHKAGKHLSKISKNFMIFDSTQLKHADAIPIKNITVDLNTARVVSVRILVSECLRMKKELQCCAVDYGISASCQPSVKDCLHVRQLEGVLNFRSILKRQRHMEIISWRRADLCSS